MLRISQAPQRRYKFLIYRRQLKVDEIQKLEADKKKTSISGFLHILTGDGQTSILNLQQMNTRINQLITEINEIDFDLNELDAEARQANQVFCPHCAAVNEIDTDLCQRCGKKIYQN